MLQFPDKCRVNNRDLSTGFAGFVPTAHIRRRRFEREAGNRLVKAHGCGGLAAKSTDIDCPLFGFPHAADDDDRNLGDRMFAHLVIDLLVAEIRFHDHAGFTQGSGHFLTIRNRPRT